MACWSVYYDLPQIIPTACYQGPADELQGPLPVPDGYSYLLEPFRNPSGVVCMNEGTRTGFLSYLLLLQVIMIPWSLSIVRVAIKVVRGDNAEDVRSDDDDEDEEELEPQKVPLEKAPMVEEEVEAESIDFEAWKRRSGVKQTVRSSGTSLSRHSDRKELLNRIGCERQIE